MTDNTELLTAVNRSGYPLQAAIADAVERRGKAYGWKVRYEEHAWKNETNGREGFIDLVLEHSTQRVMLALECKRMQNRDWIFLPPKGDPKPRRHLRGLKVMRRPDGTVRNGSPRWANHAVWPATPEGMFCIMRGDAREPTVEKIGSELVSAVEALEREERWFMDKRGDSADWSYFAAIVTTVPVVVCSYKPSTVSLADGMVPPGAKFHPSSVVRLTKQLSTEPQVVMTGISHGQEADALMKAKERTVLVVKADGLMDLLDGFAVDGRDAS